MFKSFELACLAATAMASGFNQQSRSLAEVMLQTQADAHTCTSAQERNKAPVADFYSLVAKTEKYSDPDFAPNKTSLDWADMGESELSNYASLEWTRAQVAFPKKTVFGENGITVDDVNQGSLGNCWFLAALSAVAEKKGRMETVFLNKDNYQPQAGIYGF
jgi:hypothetical protein